MIPHTNRCFGVEGRGGELARNVCLSSMSEKERAQEKEREQKRKREKEINRYERERSTDPQRIRKQIQF